LGWVPKTQPGFPLPKMQSNQEDIDDLVAAEIDGIDGFIETELPWLQAARLRSGRLFHCLNVIKKHSFCLDHLKAIDNIIPQPRPPNIRKSPKTSKKDYHSDSEIDSREQGSSSSGGSYGLFDSADLTSNPNA
jgi:hypothetical protein